MSCYIRQCSITTNLFSQETYVFMSSRQGTYISGMLDMTCLHFRSYIVQHTLHQLVRLVKLVLMGKKTLNIWIIAFELIAESGEQGIGPIVLNVG